MFTKAKCLIAVLLNVFCATAISVEAVNQAAFVGEKFLCLSNEIKEDDIPVFLNQFIIDAKNNNIDCASALNDLNLLVKQDIAHFKYLLFVKHKTKYVKEMMSSGCKLTVHAILAYFITTKIILKGCSEFNELCQLRDVAAYELKNALYSCGRGAGLLIGFGLLFSVPAAIDFFENAKKCSEAKSDLLNSLKIRYKDKLSYLDKVQECLMNCSF